MVPIADGDGDSSENEARVGEGKAVVVEDDAGELASDEARRDRSRTVPLEELK